MISSGSSRYSEAIIAELMGHRDARTTRRYTHGTERAKHEAVEAAKVSGVAACRGPAT